MTSCKRFKLNSDIDGEESDKNSGRHDDQEPTFEKYAYAEGNERYGREKDDGFHVGVGKN